MSIEAELRDYRQRLGELLRTCSFRDCDSKMAKKKIVENLRCPVESIELFQYRPSKDDCINALAAGSILFKSPLEFNDPYDSMMFWSDEHVEKYFQDERFKIALGKYAMKRSIAASETSQRRISFMSRTLLMQSRL